MRRRWMGIFLSLLLVPSGALASEAAFKSGWEAFQKRDYPGTITVLGSRPLPKGSSLKDYELWALGRSQVETSNFSAAATTLEELLKSEPDSLWSGPARVQLARALHASGQFAKAKEAVAKHLDSLKASQKQEAYFSLALAELGLNEKDAALAHLKEAYLKFPGSEVDDAIAAKLKELAVPDFSPAELLGRGERLIEAKSYSKAVEVLNPLATAAEPVGSSARLLKGEALYQLKRYGDAALYLETPAEVSPALARTALLHLGMSYFRNKEEGRAVATLEQVQQRYPGTPEGEEALYRIGMIQHQAGRFAEASQTFERLAQGYPHGSFRDKGLWAAAWSAFRRSDWPLALKNLELLDKGASDAPTQGKAIYWIGRVYEKQGDRAKAQQEWQRAVQVSPYSYYGVMALKQLKKDMDLTKVPATPAEWKLSTPSLPAAANSSGGGIAHFKKALALNRIGLGKLALPELEAAVVESEAQPGGLSELVQAVKNSDAYFARVLLGQKYWDKVKTLFNDPRGAEDFRTSLMYPYAYRDLVEGAASEFSLPPHLIVALMRQESGFMPWAISSANAQGLMQLLPSTAAPRARALGMGGYDLLDPAPNIRLGSSELANMLQRFSNNYPHAFAAYNAGPGRAKQWSEEFGFLPIDEWIEEIPFAETNLYAKLVLRNYWAYKMLYP